MFVFIWLIRCQNCNVQFTRIYFVTFPIIEGEGVTVISSYSPAQSPALPMARQEKISTFSLALFTLSKSDNTWVTTSRCSQPYECFLINSLDAWYFKRLKPYIKLRSCGRFSLRICIGKGSRLQINGTAQKWNNVERVRIYGHKK